MCPFPGFPEGKIRLTPLPAQFFSELLPEIDHLGELKVTLYAFWRLERMEGAFRYLTQQDFMEDERFMGGLGKSKRQAAVVLQDALERAVGRGVLLRATLEQAGEQEHFYFLNAPKGRAALQAIQDGQWHPSAQARSPVTLSTERPNIFRLYEENIGPLTPMIAEMLRDAEETYPAGWLEEAVQIAVARNARNWRYVEAILRSWKEKGKDEQDRRDSEKDRRRYIEGEYADYIEH